MSDRPNARFVLRDATAVWHDRVDRAFSAADLSQRASYGRFLLAQASAHLAVEQALDAAGADRVLADWPARRRAQFLRDDLAALDLAEPVLEPAPVLDGTAAMLGAIYVLEGSRLGGAMLRRSVPAGFPTAFLSAGSSRAWRDLISMLDVHLTTDEGIEAAISAACTVFALFERSGRRFIEDVERVGPA